MLWAGIVLRELQAASPPLSCAGPALAVVSLSRGWKLNPFVPRVRYRTALPGELLCVAPGIHEGKRSCGAFPLRCGTI